MSSVSKNKYRAWSPGQTNKQTKRINNEKKKIHQTKQKPNKQKQKKAAQFFFFPWHLS